MAYIVMALRTAVASAVGTLIAAITLCAIAITALAFSGDPLSAALRPRAETALNNYLATMQKRAAAGQLTALDRAALHLGVVAGIAVGTFASPEGTVVLTHSVYGDGSELRLDPTYFKRSKFLAKEIKRLGQGEHGPISFPQDEDMRLSLVFDPVFISVKGRRVRVGHPRIRFAAANAAPVPTEVPVGKLRLRVFDNLVGALQDKPFAAYAEWQMD
jgi:hypothetical protein